MAEISARVRELAGLRGETEGAFVPGETLVRCGGRVYGAEEMLNLVDSALEFWLTAGRYTEQFQRELARWYGLRSAAFVNSGSSANLLAFYSLTSHAVGERRIGYGDEIITVAAGFPTTVAPIVQFGAVPVFVDITLPTCNVDAGALEAALSPRTRAVMLAHTLGNPFDLDAVVAFCKKHNLWLIEDNCDASGSLYRGKKTGTFGDVMTLSFYPPHHMTTGEGGAVLTNSPQLATVIDSFRDWGRDCWCAPAKDNTCGKRFAWQQGELPHGYDHKYTYGHFGFNLKATDMQAAVGLAQLARLADFNKRRQENWSHFRAALARFEDSLLLPEPTAESEPSWFGFLVTVRPEAGFTRNALVAHLESKKIQTRMLFAGNLTRQPAMTRLTADHARQGRPAPYRVAGSLENTDFVMSQSFWIGVYPGLTEAMRDYVVGEITRFVDTCKR